MVVLHGPSVPTGISRLEIHHVMQLLPKLTLQFIKGHQDLVKFRMRNLPLKAQLNCDAFMIDRVNIKINMVVFTPNALNDAANTSSDSCPKWQHYRKISTILSASHIVAHAWSNGLQAKYTWTDATIATVNWEAHGSRLGKHILRNTHCTILIQELLPTNTHGDRVR